jgi:hypothetical protein
MIRLTDLSGNGSFTMGGKKFEYGKVYSNPYATAFKPVNEAEESEDHEVSMAQNQLDSIIKSATELKQKMGEEEKQIPAWIQDHITNSENYISQAASNYHEYGDSNEIKFDEIRVLSKEEFQNEASDMELVKNMEKTIKNLQYMLTKAKHPKEKENLKANIAANIAIMNWWKSRGKDESVNEAGPCWKGYKQVGMKSKGGKQVPNCVPESVMNEARSVGAIQKDFAKVTSAIASELEKYKSVKGTPKAKQYIANLKKLGAAKEKLEAELDYVVSNIYADAELEEGCGCK